MFGRCEATTGIDPFNRLADQVMACEPRTNCAAAG
jgi:hypothetical protein